MDRVFQRNLDELDKDDLKKAVDQLDVYIRYMKEQIEWAIQVLLKLNGGTSLADIANRLAKDEISIGTLNSEYNQMSTAISGKADTSDVNAALALKANITDAVMKTDITQTTKTDDDGDTWTLFRLPNGYTMATCLKTFSPTSWTQWASSDLYYVRTNAIHHGIPFTSILGEYVSPYSGEASNAKSIFVSSSKKIGDGTGTYVPTGADPNEYTCCYLAMRNGTGGASSSFCLYYLVIGITSST